MGHFTELLAYKKALNLAMEIFHQSENFPSGEKYALTSQIIRSSRAVCSNIAEGYRKRTYKKHFVVKLADAFMENTETEVWIGFAFRCNYINEETYNRWNNLNTEIGKIIHFMLMHPEKFQ